MKSDLKNYVPENIEFVLEDGVKDMFPMELDFLALTEENLCGEKPLKNKADILKFVGKHFTATFPDNELVTRFLDEFEKKNIRERSIAHSKRTWCQLASWNWRRLWKKPRR